MKELRIKEHSQKLVSAKIYLESLKKNIISDIETQETYLYP